jgi:hypothetical protein
VVNVVVRFPGSPEVRFRYDLGERSSGAIEIDVGVAIDVWQAFMNILAGVLL